jgi:uncharacterized protein YkwD
MKTIFSLMVTIAMFYVTSSIASPTPIRAARFTEASPPPVLTVSPLTAAGKATSFSTVFNVSATATWKVAKADDASWVTIGTTTTNKVSVILAANNSIGVRKTTLTFTSGALKQTATITQEGTNTTTAAAPTLVVSPASANQLAVASKVALTVTSNTAWAVTKVPATATWLTLSAEKGSGNGTVTASLAANTSSTSRTATVAVGVSGITKTVSITQAGIVAIANTSFSVTPTTGNIAGSGGSVTVNITATATAAWIATKPNDAAWLSITPALGRSSGAVVASTLSNPTTAARSTVLTFTSGLTSQKVTITQAAGAPTPTAASAVCDRDAIIQDYKNNFLGTAVTTQAELGWTGNADKCLPGIISAAAQAKTLKRVNYFRKLCGLPDVTFDNTLSLISQVSALISDANNKLAHQPAATSKCYTLEAATGCNKSNLVYSSAAYSPSATASGAVKSYMDDYLSYSVNSNKEVGHRRWVIYSKAKIFGHGSTNKADALYVIGSFLFTPNVPNFIAFPPKGYVPRTILVPRWSFAIPNADFSGAKVSVTDEAGVNYPITQYPAANGYGDNTIVWDIPAAALAITSTEDKVFCVKIAGVKLNGAAQPEYKYNVVAIDDTPAAVTITATRNVSDRILTANFNKGAKSYLWSNGATTKSVTVSNDGDFSVVVTDKNGCTYTRSTNQLIEAEIREAANEANQLEAGQPLVQDITLGDAVGFAPTEWKEAPQSRTTDTQVMLYPNPVEDQLFVRIDNLKKQQDITIQLLDINGRIVQTITRQVSGTSEQIEIDAQSIPSGIYIFKTILDDSIYTSKFVKQH